MLETGEPREWKGEYGNSLYISLNFSVNLNLLKKSLLIENTNRYRLANIFKVN